MIKPEIQDVTDEEDVTKEETNPGDVTKDETNLGDVIRYETNRGSPQTKGREDHKEFENQINQKYRKNVKGEVLSALEERYEFKFLQAEVDIWGWGARKSKVSFYSGKMDAVAFRLTESEAEVLIIDWKTSSQTDTADLSTWWDKAGNFGDALYQTLLYRELLTKHLKRLLKFDIKVGVMLVPYNQSNEELLMPGLCVDFSQMETEGMLTGLKQCQWACDKSELFHTINFPGSKMFKNLKALKELKCVDEETKLLKKDALLIDVIRDNATIADLQEEMGLLSLKVTENRREVGIGRGGKKEKRGQGGAGGGGQEKGEGEEDEDEDEDEGEDEDEDEGEDEDEDEDEDENEDEDEDEDEDEGEDEDEDED